MCIVVRHVRFLGVAFIPTCCLLETLRMPLGSMLDEVKALDQVVRVYLFPVLSPFCLTDSFANTIRTLYMGISSALPAGDGFSTVPVTQGVRQSCSFLPLLFALTLGSLLRKICLSRRVSQDFPCLVLI